MKSCFIILFFISSVTFIGTLSSVGQVKNSTGEGITKKIGGNKIDSSLIKAKSGFRNLSQKITNEFNGLSPIQNTHIIVKELIPEVALKPDLHGSLLKMGNANVASKIDNTSFSTDNMQELIYQSLAGAANVSVLNIPLSVSYNSSTGWQNNSQQLSFLSTRFDKENFLKQIKEKLNKTVNLEDFFKDALKKVYEKRDKAFETMRNDLKGALVSAKNRVFQNSINKINIENVSALGVDQFLNNIINENRQQIETKQKEIMLLQGKPELSDSLVKIERESEHLRKEANKMEEKIGSLKSKWLKNGIIQTISSFEKEKQSMITSLLNDPRQISKIAAEKLKLPFLQKILLNANSLNLGSSGVNQSTFGIQQGLMNGINLEFLKGNKYFAPILGVLPSVTNISDLSYSNFSELPDIRTAAIRMGKGSPQNDFSHLSLSVFQEGLNGYQLNGSGLRSQLPKNLVVTFSRRIQISNSNTLLAEFSKSTMLYRESSGSGNDGLKNVFGGSNFFANMGLNLDLESEYEAIGLSNRITLRYTGNEYKNLGDYTLASGSKELSDELRKSFLGRKLILKINVHYREFAFAVDKRKWRSFSYTTDARWKFKKGQFVEIRYQPYINRRISKDENYIAGRTSYFSLRGNIYKKVMRGFTYRNFVEITSSKDQFYDLIEDKFIPNSSVSFTSLQTLSIGRRTLFINTIASHARQSTNYLYGNSSLSIDGGITFFASGNLSVSSAVAYSRINQMYSQLSLKQSANIVIGERMMLDCYINAGKNMFVADGLHIPCISGNLSFSYQLK